jgi:ribonuclease VapC
LIVIDTSALIAIVLREPQAISCREAISNSHQNAISAGTLAEALIVSGCRGLQDEMSQLIRTTELEVVDVTATTSRLVAEAYRRWGKGFHPASLNFGDCFAYALAAERGWPLLYVGNDFAQTDVVAARPA